MASILSSTSHQKFRFDVFLSFRGEDTRYNFTDHLYHALVDSGFSTFRDNDEIERGQELKPDIETAIIESRASVVVLSENYANSTWCLDELCLIMEQRRKHNHFVLPVFYHVDPSDVRNQRRSFFIKRSKVTSLIEEATNLSSLLENGSKLIPLINYARKPDFSKKSSKWTEVNVKRWKTALREVANLSGLELSSFRPETHFISEVVETIKRKLDLKQLSAPTCLIGLNAQVEIINSWLKNQKSSVIAICGMGGSGKTTIAQHIYNLNKQDFQRSSFIQEIGKQPNGLLELQKILLKDVSGGHNSISSVFEGTQKIDEVLRMKKILIVLDDIDQPEQLRALLGTMTFPTQSKIIITTRILDVNSWFDSFSWRCWVHKMKLLNDIESIELLSWHAFRSKTPLKHFKELAVQLAQYCGGNPLALKVLGSSLFVSNTDPMTINNMLEIWRSRINSLNSLKGNIHSKIEGVLRKSIDTLPQRSERELFLHIACFFVGENQDVVEMMLEDELYAKSGISSLVNRCLITISTDLKLKMHQLLQDMGRNIVCEESKDPIKRSRVWHDAESYSLLRKGDGSSTIEGLSLNMRNVVDKEMGSEELALETTSLANMDKLKLLQLKYVKLTRSYDNFPKLIWLCWHGYPLQTIPSGLLMSTLVVIDMSYGHMENFEVPMTLDSVKRLRLKGCEKLVSIQNISRLPILEDLILDSCRSLTLLCESIGDHKNLKILDLTGCTKLWKHENQQDTSMMLPEKSLLSLPQSLTVLDLSNCGLEFNSDVCVVYHAQSKIFLTLADNPFAYLPNKIELNMLRYLHLYGCPNLKALPCIPSTLKELCIDWCTSLETVTFQSGHFTLRGLTYEGCFKLFEVEGLFKLVPIAKISKADLGCMASVKAYENDKVELVGDEITRGRIWHTQMLYEYGIMSTYLQGIKGQSFPTYEYTTFSDLLTFRVPRGKNRIIGLNLSCLYRASGSNVNEDWFLFAKISNITKGLTWVYNPIVFGKPRVEEDVLWVSYWPIGNILEVGDEVRVDVYVDQETMTVSGCGASLAYMVSELNDEQMCENNSNMKEEEVIGGDLSEFEVAKGCYYLCRHDIFGLKTSVALNNFFGDIVEYEDSEGWRKTLQSNKSRLLKEFTNASLREIELGVNFNNESEIDKIKKALSSIVGVESVSAKKEIGKLTVTGHFDTVEVVTCVREFDTILVEIISVKQIDE